MRSVMTHLMMEAVNGAFISKYTIENMPITYNYFYALVGIPVGVNEIKTSMQNAYALWVSQQLLENMIQTQYQTCYVVMRA